MWVRTYGPREDHRDRNQENIGHLGEAPVLFLRPSVKDSANMGTWWYITPAALQEFLEILGFHKFSINMHQSFSVQGGRPAMHYTLVASR